MRFGQLMRLGAALAVLTLSACGGDDDDDDAGGGSTTQSGGVGANGGVVSGPNGAQVVIPAGALAQNTAIAVTQSSAGAPALPSGLTPVGQVFAFTPHGTTFASPVTVAIPFDPTLVPSGASVALYKTNATQTAWESVGGATVSGHLISGQVSSFSYFTAAAPTLAANDPWPPHRIWEFVGHHANDTENTIDQGELFEGVLLEPIEFGSLSVAPSGHDHIARGEVFSNETGRTYWVAAEAPYGDVQVPGERIGGETRLLQRQFFRKHEQNATLRYTVTQAWIDAIDNNGAEPAFVECPWAAGTGPADLCLDEVLGELDLSIAVMAEGPAHTLHAVHQGTVRLWGWQDNWQWDIQASPVFRRRGYVGASTDIQTARAKPIFHESQFELTISDGAAIATNAVMRLIEPVTVEIDLSQIPACAPTTNPDFPCVGGEFFIETTATALAHNRRGRESFVGAKLRDPVSANGLDYETTGLQTIEPFEIAGPIVDPAPECTGSATSASGVLQFSSGAYGMPEFMKSSRRVLVTRTGGSEGEVIARVATSDGSAIAGTHYEPVDQLVVFGDGDDVPRAIDVPIVNDAVFSGPNTINLTLAAVGACANIGVLDEAIVTILDDETPQPTSYTVGGTVSGLTGSGLVLEDRVTGLTGVAENSVFTMDYRYQNGGSYDVRVRTQPTNPIQACTVANGSGAINSMNVTNIVVTCATPQASGSLDPSFGQGGKVVADLSSSNGAREIALQSDGKILAVGGLQLLRFNADGSPDAAFGVNGVAQIAFNSGFQDEAFAVAVQGDGRIVAAGQTRVGTQDDFAVARFNADGSVDTTFGSNGRTSIPIFEDGSVTNPPLGRRQGEGDRAYKVLPLADGDLLIAGHGGFSIYDSNNILMSRGNSYAVVRLNGDGSLDTNFGGGSGRATIAPNGVDAALAYGAAVQSDGRILIGGRYGNATTDSDVGVARFNADGSLDTAFGPADLGYVTRDLFGRSEEVRDLLVMQDGTIAIAAYGAPPSQTLVTQFTIVTFDSDGTSPNARSTTIGAGPDLSPAIAVQADGKFILAGSARDANGANPNFALVRYNPDLSVDTTFGTNGVVSVDFFGSTDVANDVVVQPDGRIVVGGVVRNGSSWDLGLMRATP